MPKFQMASLRLHTLFTLLLLCFGPFSSAHTMSLSLSPMQTASPSSSHRSHEVISAFINRAHSLKHPNKRTNSQASTFTTPLSPKVYGVHTFSLSLGTPPQTLPFVLDTSTSLVWSPCIPDHMCSFCDKLHFTLPPNASIFVPYKSSTAKTLSCASQLCASLAGSNIKGRCGPCNQVGSKNSCNDKPCPPYGTITGYGDTVYSAAYGIYLTEKLGFPEQKTELNNFVIGCTNFSFIGAAGFGRGPASMPTQMGIKKFAYCLVSHEYNDGPKSSELVLHTSSDNADENDKEVHYTPFVKITKPSFSDFKEFYYLGLEKIKVGGVDVNVPSEHLAPEPTGKGGLVVDTANPITFLEKTVYDLVSKEFEKQTHEFASRVPEVEDELGLKPCLVLPVESLDQIPRMTLIFKGGAEMETAMFEPIDHNDSTREILICMIIVTAPDDSAAPSGPSVILGNFQQQGVYMEFDLENDRLGIRNKNC